MHKIYTASVLLHESFVALQFVEYRIALGSHSTEQNKGRQQLTGQYGGGADDGSRLVAIRRSLVGVDW
jgi:hypothetical protein